MHVVRDGDQTREFLQLQRWPSLGLTIGLHVNEALVWRTRGKALVQALRFDDSIVATALCATDRAVIVTLTTDLSDSLLARSMNWVAPSSPRLCAYDPLTGALRWRRSLLKTGKLGCGTADQRFVIGVGEALWLDAASGVSIQINARTFEEQSYASAPANGLPLTASPSKDAAPTSSMLQLVNALRVIEGQGALAEVPASSFPPDIELLFAAQSDTLKRRWGLSRSTSFALPPGLAAFGRTLDGSVLCFQETPLGTRMGFFSNGRYNGPFPIETALSTSIWNLVEARFAEAPGQKPSPGAVSQEACRQMRGWLDRAG